MSPTRRDVLKVGAGAAVAGSIAGCLDLLGVETGTDADGYAAFFPLESFAEGVAGNEMIFENPVGTGRMGHGWSPPANLISDVASTEMFVYLDSAEFSWAQDVAATLERDHPDEVAVIDLLDGLEPMLLEPGEDQRQGHDDDSGHDDHDEEHGSHDGGEHDDDSGHDDHNHEDLFYDPHAWLDPLIAQEMVDRLATEFADLDSDNAATYEDNAAAYSEQIADVHQQFEETVASAELDVAVLAGHDSFQYLEHRYGFELRTPTGISPNAQTSQRDLQGLIETIEDNGVTTILYDHFEAPAEEYPQMVETLLQNTAASAAEPLSPVSGTTAEWDDRGWGWVEQMTELNLPGLDAALNPT
jgi:zinc transport system substrate-binding protein